MEVLLTILKVLGIIVLVPLAGGLLSGIDRRLTARMQGRKGPPILQPFFDVLKLLAKSSPRVNGVTRVYLYFCLIFVIFTVALFFLGFDILLVVFALTLASVFFILAGYSTNSPYAIIGAERELLQVMAYEPMVLLSAIGLYYVNKSFEISKIIVSSTPAIVYLPAIFLGLLYILTFKLRKSPFDLSTSHHGHQEIVKGITTEFAGTDLAIVEITHWYETIFALGLVYIFFAYNVWYSHLIALAVCIAVYFFEIVIDNSFARVKWQLALKLSWIVTAVAGAGNLIALALLSR